MERKHAKTVKRNFQKKRILIGHVEFINQNGVEKCGGVVVKEEKINQVANSANMFKEEQMKMMTNIKINKHQKQKNKKCCDNFGVNVVRKQDTVLKTVVKTQTS